MIDSPEEVKVLCTNCGTSLVDLPPDFESSRPPSSRTGSSPQGRLCAQCGALICPEDVVDSMLNKLSQLARFGLGADDKPLLSTKGRD